MKAKKPKPFNTHNKPTFYMAVPQEYLNEYTTVESYEVQNDERLKDIPEGCYVVLYARVWYDSVNCIEVNVRKDGKRPNPDYEKQLAAYNAKKKKYEAELKKYNSELEEYNKEVAAKAKKTRYQQFLKLQAEFKEEALAKTSGKRSEP